MNETVSRILLAGHKFMPEVYFIPFNFNPDLDILLVENLLKKEERIQNFNETCFQRDMACEEFQNLSRRTASDKVLCNKAFNIAKNLKHNAYQRNLASIVYKFYDKKSASHTEIGIVFDVVIGIVLENH